MLAIRLQRRGRKGHAQFRVIVQESRLSPKSGKVVAALGSYDPHTKESQIDAKKAEFYLSNGAQPSQRVIRLFKDQKIKLPAWAELDSSLKGALKNPEKLRKNQPAEEKQEQVAPEAEAEAAPEEKAADTTAEEMTEEEVPTETEEAKEAEKADEAPTEKSEEK